MTPDDSMLHSLNEVGTRIWDLLEEKRSLSDIVGVICEEFDVDRSNAEKDVIDFCSKVLEKGMITVIE